MRSLTALELVDAWDAAASLPLLARPGRLLGLSPAGVPDNGVTLSIGARDRALLQLREQLFGTTIMALETCPSCGQGMEVTLPTAVLLEAPATPASVSLEIDGMNVVCRPLAPSDILAASNAGFLEETRATLIERCVVSAERDEQPVAAANLPPSTINAIASALAEADPLANIELPLQCEECGEAWTARLDIGRYVWQELESRVARLLQDVNVIARAYHWPERDILSLSDRRRQRYLELAANG